MRNVMVALALLSLALVAVVLNPVAARAQSTDGRLTSGQLKDIVAGLGYNATVVSAEPGRESFQIPNTQDGIAANINVEVSTSGRYIWLTSNLGVMTPRTSAVQLLAANATIQPSQFYQAPNRALYIGLPLDNRSLTPDDIRAGIEKLRKDIVSTGPVWQTR